MIMHRTLLQTLSHIQRHQTTLTTLILLHCLTYKHNIIPYNLSTNHCISFTTPQSIKTVAFLFDELFIENVNLPDT